MSKNKKQAKLLSSNATDVAEAVREGSSAALEKTGPYLEKANALIHAGAEAAAPRLREAGSRLQQAADTARPKVEAALESGRERAEEAFNSAREQIDSRYGEQIDDAKVELTKRGRKVFAKSGDQLTRASKLIASTETPAGVENLVSQLTGDKKAVKKVKKALSERSADLAKAAKKEAKRQAKAEKKGLGWFTWVLIFGAAGAIGYFVYRAVKPVEDPWSTPLPGNRPADARPVGSTPASEAGPVSPVVSEVPVPDDAVEPTESDDADEEEDGENAEQ